MKRIAVMIYGAPGAGKGTQANLLAWKRDYFHFDTGRYLESVVRDPANKNNKLIQRQKKAFETGKLMTPSFVLKVIKDKANEVGKAKLPLVFSGSPRTMYETFGDSKTSGLVKVLEKYYGRKNLYFIYIDIKPETSIKRNSSRKVCSVCSTVISGTSRPRHCPICMGALRVRALDKVAVIKRRLIEYRERTFPILEALRKHGYKVYRVNGEALPDIVHERINKVLPK